MATTRHVLLLALGFAVSSPVLVPSPAVAQQDADIEQQGQVENAKFKFKGKTTGPVFVRSGPSNNFYPTIKLERNAEVTVVGIKYQWLKILPPKGSFSYVPKAYVERRGTGKVGRVTNALNVRAGSTENMIKTTVQTKLNEGQDVTILGEQDEYYKIVPPEGAYLFIHEQYVKPDGPGEIADGGDPAAAPAKPEGEVANAQGKPDVGTGDVEKPTEADGSIEAENPQSEPAGPDTQPIKLTETPAPKPAPGPSVAEEFRKLEAEFEEASKRPVVEQPLERLTEGYTNLVADGKLSGQMKRVAEAKLMALEMRSAAREQLQAFRKGQLEWQDRRKELETEKMEIDEQVARTEVKLYSAVGLLRISSLQQGDLTLYRLTDPATQRTVAYLRSNDPKYPGLLNQFVGVRGDVTTDPRLKMTIITPTEAEAVNPSKVNSTVIATITPPSMVTIAEVNPGQDAAE